VMQQLISAARGSARANRGLKRKGSDMAEVAAQSRSARLLQTYLQVPSSKPVIHAGLNAGLQNPHNCCYMNAALQIMFHSIGGLQWATDMLAFAESQFPNSVDVGDASGCVELGYVILIARALKAMTTYSTTHPVELYNTVVSTSHDPMGYSV
jgi:ubiquitin C-terminal hydrolase